MAEIVIAFILFGRVLGALKADRFLTDAALAVMGRYRGAPAKVAVGASSLFGTISGSAVSNVMIDGPITIPMMVRAGYAPPVAAAIEAVASTGGQIMPPVMGITAFLIADWLGIPYGDVVIAAALPALLYYVALFVQIDLEAAKHGLVGLPREQIPRLMPILRGGWVFFVPLFILVFTLIELSWEAGRAAIAAVIAAIVIGVLDPRARPSLRTLWNAVCDTGQSVLELVVITAIAGLVIGALQLSGLAFGMSLILVTLAQGNMFLLLLLTALLCIVLGMGMPTAVIYILLAILVAPSLTEFGIEPLAAHLFLFYFGMLSMITPPMCLATFAAATIARCNFWSAGWAGTRLGIVAYIVPFVFVFHPELLMIGAPLDVLLAVASALVGIYFIAASCAGYVFSPVPPLNRVVLFLAGLCMIPSPAQSSIWLALNFGGLLAGLGILVWQKKLAPRAVA
jgi:TRAP transporter 4TM/12TM fusion protein